MFRKELQVASRIRNAISPSCCSAAPGPKISGIASARRRRRGVPHVMDTRFKDRPLLAVIGCTGTGKTKLGVRLAKELDGEVVSADSIQVSRAFCCRWFSQFFFLFFSLLVSARRRPVVRVRFAKRLLVVAQDVENDNNVIT